MKMRGQTICPLALVSLSLVLGCQTKNEVPDHMRGSYRLKQILGSDNRITLTAKELKVEDCKVNCGDETIHFDSIDCEFGSARCVYRAKQCAGSLQKVRGEKELKITATPVDKDHDYATCNNISGTMEVE